LEKYIDCHDDIESVVAHLSANQRANERRGRRIIKGLQEIARVLGIKDMLQFHWEAREQA
jgi:hypothetical protein